MKQLYTVIFAALFATAAQASDVTPTQGQTPAQEMQGQNPATGADAEGPVEWPERLDMQAIIERPLIKMNIVDSIYSAGLFLNGGKSASVKWLYINLPVLRDRAAEKGVVGAAGRYRVKEIAHGIYELRAGDRATSVQLNEQPAAFLGGALRAAAPYIPESQTCAVYKPVELKRNLDATTYKAITLECRQDSTAQVPASKSDTNDYKSALLYPGTGMSPSTEN